MEFLFDNEDTLGVNSFISGTCDIANLDGHPRPPDMTTDKSFCEKRYEVYTPRMNLTSMDIASSGLPKPQYCTSDPQGTYCDH